MCSCSYWWTVLNSHVHLLWGGFWYSLHLTNPSFIYRLWWWTLQISVWSARAPSRLTSGLLRSKSSDLWGCIATSLTKRGAVYINGTLGMESWSDSRCFFPLLYWQSLLISILLPERPLLLGLHLRLNSRPRMRMQLRWTNSFQVLMKSGFRGQRPVSLLIIHFSNTQSTSAGDEANAIATAPAVAKVESVFPLVQPDTSDHQGESFDIMQHWGNLSPFNSVKTFGLSNASARIPKGCELTQVHLLHRHGARYPTNGSAPSAFASRLHAAASSGTGFNASGPLDFLNTWTYKLGADILSTYTLLIGCLSENNIKKSNL